MSFQDELSTFVEGFKRQLDAGRNIESLGNEPLSIVSSVSMGFPSRIEGSQAAQETRPILPPQQWPLSLTVLSDTVTYFGPSPSTSYDLPGGNYQVYYLSGAANYSTSAPGLWGVAAYASDGVTPQGPRVTYAISTGFVGTFGYFANSATAESASTGQSLVITHTGGPIYMEFIDENYADNAGGPILFNLIGPF